MDNQCRYTKAIVLGSGNLAYQCALVCREHLRNVEVLEYKVTKSTTLQKMCQRDQIPYSCCDKLQMRRRLEQEMERSLIVSAGNTFLIPESIIEKSSLTIVNWHNALLPEHKGRNAESWSIYEGDAVTGITWHMISPEIDAGDIIVQKEIFIDSTITALKLYQKQSEEGLQAFRDIIVPLLAGQCRLQKQRESKTAVLHLSKEIPNEGRLDLEWNFEKTSRFLRAMDYGALRLLGEMYVSWEGIKYCFHKYEITPREIMIGGSGRDVVWQGRDMLLLKEDYVVRLRKLRAIDSDKVTFYDSE